jgi:hypothetical protein
LSGDSWRLVYECSEFGLFYFKLPPWGSATKGS